MSQSSMSAKVVGPVSRQFASAAAAVARNPHPPSLLPPIPPQMPTSMPAMEQHFRPLKVTDIAPVLKPRDVLAGWRQRQQKGGIQIERNCSDLLYQQMAQAVVDAYGWDNSAHDYGVWLRAFGPEKFSLFLAMDKTLGQPAGSMSLANLSDNLAQLSMFFVHSQYRGQRIGHKLFQLAVDQAGDRSVFCYGVADMWAKYATEFGMNHFPDWRLWNLQAHAANALPERLDTNSSVELVDWRHVSFPELVAFDRLQTAGIDRSQYLREALRQPQSVARVALEKGTRRVVGMCQARQLLNRRLGISLFYAESPSIASALLRQVLLEVEPSNQFSLLVYKTPSTNSESVRLFEQLVDGQVLTREELQPQFSQKALPLPGKRIFSIGDEHASLV